MQNTVGQIPLQASGQPYTQIEANGQSVAVPNHSGVNIQIFNPSVVTPGSQAPVYNVNAPSYPSYGTNSGVYPSNYYTDRWGDGGNTGNGANGGLNQSSGSNTNTNNTTNTTEINNKKTEKRKVVELTDDYIKNLENYLNSKDPEVRFMGAKEVVERLQEDDSRSGDKALNALINKMIQDPSGKIRLLGLSMLDARLAIGDDFTVKVLTDMQNSTAVYGHDAVLAANILLKMSGKQVEKEFEIKSKPYKDDKKG